MNIEKKPHVHAEVIKAWADGNAIEYRRGSTEKWQTVEGDPAWYTNQFYRVKPAEPEKVYPVTQLSGDALYELYYDHEGELRASMVYMVNTAIRHGLDNSYLFSAEAMEQAKARKDAPSDWRENLSALRACANLLDNMDDSDALNITPKFLAEKLASLAARNADRDMAIAEAVKAKFLRVIEGYSYGAHFYCVDQIDLPKIIAGEGEMSAHTNGADGMGRVDRSPHTVMDCLIHDSLLAEDMEQAKARNADRDMAIAPAVQAAAPTCYKPSMKGGYPLYSIIDVAGE